MSSALSVFTFRTAPEALAETVLPAGRFQIGKLLGLWLRRGYGFYKLASAPREAYGLLTARPGTALARLIAEPGRIEALATRPFVSARWPVSLRLRRVIEHCAVIDRLGPPFDIARDQYVEFIDFPLDGERCRLMLDRPRWLTCDGMLSVSLWAGASRIFTISFCLADSEAERTAYIGGLQGHRSADALDRNRALTKAAHGMRPRDLAFDLFRMLIPLLGVTRVNGVADAGRYQLTKRAAIGLEDKVQLDYDEIWESRGGILEEDGFYLVPVGGARREIADISVKKRSMYKRRYAMLDELEADVIKALQQPRPVRTHANRF